MGSYAEDTLVRGLSFLAEKQAAIANNLANVDTTAFKRRAAVAQATPSPFQAMLEGQMPAVSYVERNDMQRGILRETGNRFDVAIDGEGWLRVQDQKGTSFYTRNGQLQIDDQGRLVTRNGLAVLDEGGQPIVLGNGPEAPSDVTISPNGTIQNPVTGQTWGPIAVVTMARQDALVPVGKGLFVDTEGQRTTQVGDGVQQGFLEGSNVDSLQELVQMIAVERSFTATQKALTGVGRLQGNMIEGMLR